MLHGCIELSHVPASVLLGCDRLVRFPAKLLQGCGNLSGRVFLDFKPGKVVF